MYNEFVRLVSRDDTARELKLMSFGVIYMTSLSESATLSLLLRLVVKNSMKSKFF